VAPPQGIGDRTLCNHAHASQAGQWHGQIQGLLVGDVDRSLQGVKLAALNCIQRSRAVSAEAEVSNVCSSLSIDRRFPKLDAGVCPIRARLLSVSSSIERPISGPSLSHSQLPKSLAILSEIRDRVVEDSVIFEKSVDLHPRLESKEPPKLRSSDGMRPIGFERQAFVRYPAPVESPSQRCCGGTRIEFCVPRLTLLIVAAPFKGCCALLRRDFRQHASASAPALRCSTPAILSVFRIS
jgi:hypothetical protein